MKTNKIITCFIFMAAQSAAFTAEPPAAAAADARKTEPLGNVLNVKIDGRETLLQCQNGFVRVNFWSDNVVRMQVSEDGSFSSFNDAKAFMIQPGLAAFGVLPES